MNDLNRTKKITYTVAGLLLLLILGFILYRYLAPPTGTKTTGGKSISGGLSKTDFEGGTGGEGENLKEVGTESGIETPVVGGEEQVLTKSSSQSVVLAGLGSNQNKILFYNKDGGDLFSLDIASNNQEKISNITIVGLIEVIWSSIGNAALFYLDGETVKGFLHLGGATVNALPQNVKSFAWSPDGKSLTYLVEKDNTLQLVIADYTGRGAKTVFSTPLLDSRITWISSDKIAFETAPSGLAEGYIFIYSRSSGSFGRILGPIFGLTSLWSPDASGILISSTNTNGGNLGLSVHDALGKGIFTISLATLPKKCVWADKKTIYCAVPRTISNSAIWPDDYYRGEINTSDRLVVLDLEKKEIRQIFNEDNFDMSQLTITKEGDKIFFVNRTDGKLWNIKINP